MPSKGLVPRPLSPIYKVSVSDAFVPCGEAPRMRRFGCRLVGGFWKMGKRAKGDLRDGFSPTEEMETWFYAHRGLDQARKKIAKGRAAFPDRLVEKIDYIPKQEDLETISDPEQGSLF